MKKIIGWTLLTLCIGLTFIWGGIEIAKESTQQFVALIVLLFIPFLTGIITFILAFSKEKIENKHSDLEVFYNKKQQDFDNEVAFLKSESMKTIEAQALQTKQLSIIVNNINSGICFVDKDFNIESGYNEIFVNMFGDKEYLNQSIMNSVFGILDDQTKSSVVDYLELAFVSKTASASILNDASPIKEFEFVQVIDGTVKHSIIESSISIIKNSDNKIEKLMFMFHDVTAETALKEELEKRDKDYKKRYSIMVALFGNDKTIIKRFIQGLEEDVKTLSVKIKELKQNEKNSNTIADIVGTVHSIKGEAFALGFEKLSDIAGKFETFFKKIKNEVLGLESNLEIIGFYEKLNNEKREFDRTISTLQEFLQVNDKVEEKKETKLNMDIAGSVEKYLAHENVPFSLLEKELQLINESASKELGKKSNFTLNSSIENIDSKRYKILKELFLHMIRNSIAHGIELPAGRISASKDQAGKINLDVAKAEESIIFEYSDDGTGFDIAKIKEHAIKKNIASAEEISGMSNMDILRIVFNDGFSTSGSSDMISGAGVGMSVVKKNILKELKGKLNLINKPGKGIKIRITIPA